MCFASDVMTADHAHNQHRDSRLGLPAAAIDHDIAKSLRKGRVENFRKLHGWPHQACMAPDCEGGHAGLYAAALARKTRAGEGGHLLRCRSRSRRAARPWRDSSRARCSCSYPASTKLRSCRNQHQNT